MAHPMKVITCGLFPWATFFIVSISCKKSVRSLPEALPETSQQGVGEGGGGGGGGQVSVFEQENGCNYRKMHQLHH